MQQLREWFWRNFSPMLLKMRDGLLKVGILRHHGDQAFHIGWIRGDRTLADFEAYIRTQGFGNHMIAWVDEHQLLGLRRRDGFRYQYHLRVYEDGEVRGHYEVTPEAGFWNHFLEWEIQPKREEFLKFLGDWITFEKPRANEMKVARSPIQAKRYFSTAPASGSDGGR